MSTDFINFSRSQLSLYLPSIIANHAIRNLSKNSFIIRLASLKITSACKCQVHSVCRQTAIHNLHATSLNGAVMFILRKDERVLLPRSRKAAVRTTCLVYILYYTLFALPFQPRLYVCSLLSRREVASKVSPADAFYGSPRSKRGTRHRYIYRDVSGYRLFPNICTR